MKVKKKILKCYVHIRNKISFIFKVYLPNFNSNSKLYCEGAYFNQKVIVNGHGRVEIGSDTILGYELGGRFKYGYIELQARSFNSTIKIGNNVSINNNLFICCQNSVKIGNNTLIGEGVTIFDFDGHGILPENRSLVGEIGSVEIANNVWIGTKVVILKNTIIGDNTIIAAGSIVKGIFPPNVILAGVPARIVKNILIGKE